MKLEILELPGGAGEVEAVAGISRLSLVAIKPLKLGMPSL